MRKLPILLFLFALPTLAQQVTTFEEAAQSAAQYNADLRAARANTNAAERRVKSAASGFLPELYGNVSYGDSSGSASTAGTSYSTGITATQNLFAGFQDRARVDQAKANLESAEASLVSAKAQLSYDLKVAYAGLLYAQDSVVLTEAILRRLEDNLRLVELRFEAGRENKGASLLSRASVAQAQLDGLQARQAVETGQTQLARVLGQPPTAVRAAGAVPIAAPPPTPDFAALAQTAPDVRDAAARERSSEADVALARAGFYPSVNVSASVGRDDDNWYPQGTRRNVGASVSIPLYSGGRDYHDTRAAQAALDVAKARRESTEQQRLLQLRQTYAAYVEAIDRLRVSSAFVEAAQTRATIARARYQNGLVSFDEWDRIESDLVQRQKALLVTQHGRVEAEAAWDLAQGNGVIP